MLPGCLKCLLCGTGCNVNFIMGLLAFACLLVTFSLEPRLHLRACKLQPEHCKAEASVSAASYNLVLWLSFCISIVCVTVVHHARQISGMQASGMHRRCSHLRAARFLRPEADVPHSVGFPLWPREA